MFRFFGYIVLLGLFGALLDGYIFASKLPTWLPWAASASLLAVMTVRYTSSPTGVVRNTGLYLLMQLSSHAVATYYFAKASWVSPTAAVLLIWALVISACYCVSLNAKLMRLESQGLI